MSSNWVRHQTRSSWFRMAWTSIGFGRRTPQRKQIAVVGRLISNKGPEDALEAFAKLGRSDWQLVFVGDGPMRRRLEQKASELGLRGIVQFLGARDDIPAVLSQSAIVVRPSLTEGRSLTIMEAMASGTCVVASDIVANRELIRHGVTGILTPVGDHLLLAEALRRLVDDAARRLSIGAAARDAILRSTWDATASKTAEVLVEVASEEPTRVISVAGTPERFDPGQLSSGNSKTTRLDLSSITSSDRANSLSSQTAVGPRRSTTTNRAPI